MTGDRHPLTVEDLWALARVGAPRAGADGSTIVVPVTTYDMETNQGTTRLYRVFLDGREPVPLTAEGVSSGEPAVSPDGARVALVRKDAHGKGQLALLDLAGGEAQILTDLPLGVLDPRWFPDGRRLAFLAWLLADAPTPQGTKDLLAAREADPVKVHVTEDRVFRYWDGWLTDGRVPHLFVLDLETRALRDLTPDSRRWLDLMEPHGNYDISPDGREIAISLDRSDPPHAPTNWDIFTVAVESGEMKNLTSQNPADDVRPRYSPDGRYLLYGMQRENDFYADRFRLVLVERATGRHHVLTEAWDRSAQGWEFAGRDGIVFTAEDGGRVHLYRAGLAPGEPALAASGGTLSDPAPLADGSFLALHQDVSHPAEVVHVAGTRVRPLTAFNAARLASIQMGEVRDLVYTGSDGKQIQAFVVLPPGFDPGKAWPLLLLVHGGPHGAFADQFHFRWNYQVMAARGHVVLAPNFHGSTGWGQEFAASIHGGWGDKPYRDVMAAVDAILAQGYVDERRMAAAGGSYGGYLAAWIAGRTDRFACLINHAGVADTLAEYASDVTWGRSRELGGEPWKGLEAIDAMNPVRFARNFKTPMLVLHGEKDYRVPVTQGLEIYSIYKAMGLPARLVYFPDENHWILKPRNSRLWFGEFFGWLDRWLGTKGPRAATRP